MATGEPTLQEVNIFLERALITGELATKEEEGATRLLLFDWMSDGERSFLGRMAMLAMLQTENSTDPSEIMIIVFRTGLSTGVYATQLLESAVASGDRTEVANLLEAVGPGMWLFRLQRRL